MGVKSMGRTDCVQLPEIVVSPADSVPTPGQRLGLREGKLHHPRDTSLLPSGWDVSKSCDWPLQKKKRSNQSTSVEYSVEDDLHHNGIEEKNLSLERWKKTPHSERYQSYEMKSRGSIESTPAPIPTNGICRSKSFTHRKQADHLRAIHNKSVLHATRSDTFLVGSELVSTNNENNNNKSHKEQRSEEGRRSKRKSTKLGDTKALIEKYINSSTEQSLAYYQSDLSFLYRNRTADSSSTGGNLNFLLKRNLLWTKTKDKTAEELNMLDLGNSYTRKTTETSDKTTMGGILTERNVPITTPLRSSFEVPEMRSEKTPKKGGATAKRVIFNEDSTKVMDVVEVEPTLEFAERLGRRDSEGSSLSVRDRDSLASTPVSRSSSELKPILKNTGSQLGFASQSMGMFTSQQGGDTTCSSSSAGWSEYYQDSSNSDSDSDYGVTPLSSREPLRLPHLSWSNNPRTHIVSSPSYVAASRFKYERSATLPLRSRTLSEIPIRRSSSPKKKFQCSKEFAHALKNLDSENEDNTT